MLTTGHSASRLSRTSLVFLLAFALGACAARDDEAVGALEQDETTAAANAAWVARFVNPKFDDVFTGVGSDAAGNVYVAGQLGTVQHSGVRIVKYAPGGKVAWDKEFALRVDQENCWTLATAFSVAPNGDVWIAGTVRSGQITSTSIPPTSLFVARLDAHGVVRLSEEIGPPQENDDASISGIAADPNGGAAIRGRVKGSLDLPGRTLSGPADAVWGNSYVAKLDAIGRHVWSRILQPAENTIAGLAMTDTGDLYVSGQGCYPDFGAGPIQTPPNYFCHDFFLAKLAATDGHQFWGKGAGAAGFSADYTGPLAALPAGGVAVAGTYPGYQAPDFGSGTLPSTGGPFVVAFASDGSLQYARSYPELHVEDAGSLRLAALPTGGLAMAGASSAGSAAHHRLHKVSMLTADGTLTRSWTVETYDFCTVYGFCGKTDLQWGGLAATPDGSPVIAASYAFEVHVGGKTFVADNSQYAQYDAFVAKLSP
jgi:hypothetical protein